MKQYVSNLLPRLVQYSKKLDKVEHFVDKTWTFHNSDGTSYSYRFRRNKTLLVSTAGDVDEWTWEYIAPDSLYVKRGNEGKMFRQAFVLDGLLIMKKEGSRGLPSIFYNEAVIPDGDVETYLRTLYIQKNGLKILKQNLYYEDPYGQGLMVGSDVLDENFRPAASTTATVGNKQIIIKDGKVTARYIKSTYDSDQGAITVWSVNEYYFSEGDLVFTSTGTKAVGTFKLNTPSTSKTSLTVDKGKIVSISESSSRWLVGGIVTIMVIVITAVIYSVTKNEARNIKYTASKTVPEDTTTLVLNAYPIVDDSGPTLDKYTVRSNVASFFDKINERSFETLQSYIADTVNDFYGTGMVSSLDAQYKFKDYWEDLSNQCRINYEEDDLEVLTTPSGFTVEGNIAETITKGFHDIPYINISKVTYNLNKAGKINSFQGKVLGSYYDVYQMFGFEEDVTMEDLKLRNRKEDWDKIFGEIGRITSTKVTVADDYCKAVQQLYGNEVIIEYDNTFVYLSEFLLKIVQGELKVSYVKGVEKADGPGKLVSVAVVK